MSIIQKEHPGWKTGGMIIRPSGERFTLFDNGKYDQINETWVFKARSAFNVDSDNSTKPTIPAYATWYIAPLLDDIYVPPITVYTYDRKGRIPPTLENSMLTRNWIVVSSANGPSHCPNKHTSEQAAIDEAKRLALKHPSDTFFVYELHKAFKVENVKEIEVGDIPF